MFFHRVYAHGTVEARFLLKADHTRGTTSYFLYIRQLCFLSNLENSSSSPKWPCNHISCNDSLLIFRYIFDFSIITILFENDQKRRLTSLHWAHTGRFQKSTLSCAFRDTRFCNGCTFSQNIITLFNTGFRPLCGKRIKIVEERRIACFFFLENRFWRWC